MTDNLKVEIDASELQALVKKFPEFEDIIFQEMTRAMHGSLTIFEEQVTGRTPVVTGILRNSIAGTVRGQPPNFTGLLTTPIVYGEPVERGRDLPGGGKSRAAHMFRDGFEAGEPPVLKLWNAATERSTRKIERLI